MCLIENQRRKVQAFRTAVEDFIDQQLPVPYVKAKIKILIEQEHHLARLCRLRFLTPLVLYQATLYPTAELRIHLKVIAKDVNDAKDKYKDLGRLVVVADLGYIIS